MHHVKSVLSFLNSKKNHLKSLFLMVFFTAPLLVSCGAFASDFWSPRTAALGGAGRAGPLLNDALLLNPSFVAFLVNRVSGAIHYSRIDGGRTGDGGRQYHVSMQDSRSPLFSAGLAYTQREDGSTIHFGASRVFFQRMGIGLSGKFLFNPERNSLTQDMTASLTWAAARDLQLAFIADNLIESPEGRARGLYREFALGSKYNLMGMILIYFDPHFAPTLEKGKSGYGYELGTEFVIFRDLFLRFGTFRNSLIPWDNVRGQGYGSGIGWLGPRLSFDFGLSRVIAPIASTGYQMGVTMYF
jgi:hypothetical protein